MRWSEATWRELVSDLYRSSSDRAAGARLPGHLKALLGGSVASIWELRQRDCAVVGQIDTSVPSEAVEAYCDRFYQYDPWQPAVQKRRFGTVLQGFDIVDTDALARSVFYNEFAAEYGMFHMVGAVVPLGTGPDMTAGALTILRPLEAGHFDAEAVRVTELLLPHLSSAMQLRKEVANTAASVEQQTIEALLEALGVPALVVDGCGAVLNSNDPAEDIALVREALSQRANPHRLLAMPPGPVRDRWERLVASAANGEAGGACLVPGQPDVLLTVTPLPRPVGAASSVMAGRALVILRPLGVRPRPASLAAFGLTPAEAEAATALAAGDSPAEIAITRGVKISTIRTLLARAQDKMHARNLRDLVRLVLALN